MKQWNLPESYCVIARDHHEEQFDGDKTVMSIVRLVDSTCNKLGIGTPQDEGIVQAVSQEADFLGLSEVSIAQLEVNLEDCMEKLGGM